MAAVQLPVGPDRRGRPLNARSLKRLRETVSVGEVDGCMDSAVMVKAALAHWREILMRWCAIVEQHCRIAAQLPWWDSEVANAALLSSAAMQCGYASLVESTGTKDGRGRSDLWVQFGP